MKKQIILLSFITVIAVAIGALYFTRDTGIETYQAAETSVDTSKQNPLTATTEELAEAPAAAESAIDTVTKEPETTTATPAVTTPVPVVPTPTPTQMPMQMPATMPMHSNDYNNGTYTSTVTYSVPEGGRETLTITMKLSNDTVSDLTVSYNADKRESEKYLDRFSGAIDSYVIGEPVNDLSLSRVGGASLTTRAFNNALAEIKLDAAA